MKARLLLGVIGAVVLVVAVAVAVVLVVRSPGRTGAGHDGDRREMVRGMILGSVQDVDGAGVGGAEVFVTAAGTGELVATSTSDPLGLFEVEVGDEHGPVTVRATRGDQSAATVVAVSREAAATGVRLVVGDQGGGEITGLVTADGVPVGEAGVVEARFVESGRTAVADFGADGTYTLSGLPLDGDLILVATLASGERQGLTAGVVSGSSTAGYADIALGVAAEAGANQVEGPHLVTDDMTGWSLDGPVSVVPPE
jgi:hypothetical protein